MSSYRLHDTTGDDLERLVELEGELDQRARELPAVNVRPVRALFAAVHVLINWQLNRDQDDSIAAGQRGVAAVDKDASQLRFLLTYGHFSEVSSIASCSICCATILSGWRSLTRSPRRNSWTLTEDSLAGRRNRICARSRGVAQVRVSSLEGQGRRTSERDLT